MSTRQRFGDAGVVLVLVALVLLGLDDTFSSRAYLGTGLAGAVTVVLVALAVTGAQRPRTAVFLLGAAALYVPVGAVAAFRPYEEGRVPSGEELVDVLTGTITGAEDLLTTIPPLDPIGSVMVLPYAVGYVLGGASVWLALRTRAPLAPVVPLLLAQAVVILLGPLRSGQQTLLLGAGFAGLAFWWAARRASRRGAGEASVAHAERGRSLRAVGAGATVALAVAVVSQLVPTVALDGDRTVLRGRIGSGASIDEFDNPLTGFRRYTDQNDGSPDNVNAKTLFVVDGLDGPTAIRFVTLDTYDGTAWRAGNRTVADAEDDLYQRIGSVVAAPRPGTPVEVSVEMREAYTSAWLPLVGQLTGIDFDYADGRAQREDVRYNPATGSATVVGGLAPGDDYTFTASVPDAKLGKRSRAYPVAAPLQPAGEPLDAYLAPYVATGRDPLVQVLLLARYLERNGRYSDGTGALQIPAGHSIGRLVDQFVGAPRIIGNDEQYAAFMALAANRLRVPARVVVGAYSGNGKVQGKDVLAWVELRVSDGSWRTLPTATFMSHRRPSRDDEPPQPPSDFIDDELPAEDEPTQQPEQLPLPEDGSRPDQPGADDAGGLGARAPLAALLLVLLGGTVPGLRLVRRAVRRRRGTPARRVAAAWRELLDAARDLRAPYPPGATREAQAAALGLDPELARRTDDLVFAVVPPDERAAVEYWREVDRARRALGRGRPLRQRVLAVWNPASLLAPVRGRLAGRSRRRARLVVWRT